MTDIRIQPAGAPDQPMHEEKYEELRAALEADGYNATVDIGFEKAVG
jgi:hypothetical protein